jgi:hypothetical protein
MAKYYSDVLDSFFLAKNGKIKRKNTAKIIIDYLQFCVYFLLVFYY